MKIFLSYVLDENTPTYGDRDKFTITPKSQIVDGVGANTSTWSFSNNFYEYVRYDSKISLLSKFN